MAHDSGIIDYVARLAPEIDRLFRAGHHAARPFGGPIIQRLRLSKAFLLIDLRKLLLSPAGMTRRAIRSPAWKMP